MFPAAFFIHINLVLIMDPEVTNTPFSYEDLRIVCNHLDALAFILWGKAKHIPLS